MRAAGWRRRRSKRLLAAVAVALVAASLEAVPAGAAVDRPLGGTSTTVPPIVSPPADLTGELPVSPQPHPGDVSAVGRHDTGELPAPSATEGYDPSTSVELLGARDALAKVFANADGTRTLVSSPVPVHYHDGASWLPIDTRVVLDTSRPSGRLRTAANSWTARFGRADEGVTIETASDVIAFAPVGAAAVLPTVGADGSSVVYADVWPGVDLRYDVRPHQLEESIVVREPGAPARYAFTVDRNYELDVATGGLTLGGAAGAMWRVAPPVLAGAADGPVPVYDVDTTASGGTVAVEVDAAWLASVPAGKLPVVIDPTYVAGGAAVGYAHNDGNPCNPCQVRVGNYHREVEGDWYWRSQVHFPYMQLAGSFVQNAHVELRNNRGDISVPHDVDLYHAVSAGFDGLGDHLATQVNATSAAWLGGSLTTLLREAVNLDDFGVKLAFAGEEFPGWFTYQEWHSFQLHVNYNAPPSTPALLAPPAGDQSHTRTPALSWSASDPEGAALTYDVEVWNSLGEEWSWTGGASSVTVPAGFALWNTTYWWRVQAHDQYGDSAWSEVRSFVPSNNAPPAPQAATPSGTSSDPAWLTTTTPAFEASAVLDPDVYGGVRDRVQYQFQLSSGTSVESGHIVVSPWSDWSATAWQPSAGTMQDGGTYSWRVRARDEWGAVGVWSAASTFRVDFRLGKQATLPYDDVGPVSVNLATGNLVVSAGGPSFPTVGGPVGVSFTYNSQAPAPRGLTGDYFQDLNRDGAWQAATEPRLLHRVDAKLHIDWGAIGPDDGPSPGVIAPEWWGATWTGSFVPPVAGSYTFLSSLTDDTVKVTLNGEVVLNAATCCQTVAGSSRTLAAGSVNQLRVDYAQHTGPERLRLMVRDPNGAEYDIPSAWLHPTSPSLPGGWSRTGDFLGGGEYTALRPLSGATTVAVDETGADHAFNAMPGGGWRPPHGEDSVLTQRPDGTWTLLGEDGYVYRFDPGGRLLESVSAVDDVHPGAPRYTYGAANAGGPLRLLAITDASSRVVNLSYGGQAGCPGGGGFEAAPANMLCRVTYAGFGGGSTELYYSGGHLARIVNPGSEIVDFGYDTGGRMTAVRDALTNDLIAGGVIPASEASSDTHKTLIGHAGGRVTSVTAPVPAAGSNMRAARTYVHAAGTSTKVFVAGLLSDPAKPARQVTLDAAGHATTDVDAAGIATVQTWDVANDRLVKSVRGGLQTTHHYDTAGRLTDTYGPAAPSEFAADNRSATAPHERRAYDEGMPGLAAAWYGNDDLTQTPKRHALSSAQEDWGTGSPDASVPADGFSGRLTGDVDLPVAGSYGFAVDGTDNSRVFVDDQLVIDRWNRYADVVLRDRPAAYWRLGELAGSVAADASGNGRVGTYGGALARAVPGALVGDSDRAVAVDVGSVSGSFPLAVDNFAFEAWVRPDVVHEIDAVGGASGGLAGQRYAFAPEHGGGSGAGVGLSVGVNGVSVYEHGADYLPAVAVYSGVLSGWNHVVVNYVNRRPHLYVNGRLVATGNVSPRSAVYGPRVVGWHPYGGASGGVDEVAFYGTPLTETAIASRYSAGTATFGVAGQVLADDPIAYWRLGEMTSSSRVLDASGNGHAGDYDASGAPASVAAALVGDSDNAASFIGALRQQAWVAPTDELRLNGPFTIEFWARLNSFTSTFPGLLRKGAASGASGYLVWYGSDGAVHFKRNGVQTTSTPPGALVTDRFRHFTVAYDGSRARWYVDGEQVSDVAVTYPASTGTDSLQLGHGDEPGAHRLDEVAMYDRALSPDRVRAHFRAGRLQGSTGTLPAGRHRLRVEYRHGVGSARLGLVWAPPAAGAGAGAVEGAVPAARLSPRYGLVTTAVDADGNAVATEYASPALGLATASVVDPAGLALRSTTSYEPAAVGAFHRRVGRTLPKGAASAVSYAYYGITEAPSTPAGTCIAGAGTSQGGALRFSTDASGLVREYRYDVAGRVVASRMVGDADWTCTSYDARGRVVSVRDRVGRTTTNDYSVPGIVTTSYVDSAGGSRTTVAGVDWVGRPVSYTDEHGTVTETSYDQAGRVVATYRTLSGVDAGVGAGVGAGAPRVQLTGSVYDGATGRLVRLTEFVSGASRDTVFGYDPVTGALVSTARPNGVVTTATLSPTRGWLTDLSNRLGASELSPWHYTRRPSGDVETETGAVGVGAPARTRAFTYDGAGRLSQTVEGGTLARRYVYDANSNRCLVTSSLSAGCSSGATYSYDAGDRLLSSPFATGYTYDTHGNTTSASLVTTALTGSLSETFPLEDVARMFPVSVGRSGTLELLLSWSPTSPSPSPASYVTVAVLDPLGVPVASDVSTSPGPKSLSVPVVRGGYRVVVTAVGTGTAALSVSYPQVAASMFEYDANDHAVSVDDGVTTTKETLSPSGRVLRRQLVDSVTAAVLDDVLFGYADGSDTAAYTRRVSDGVVTTYVGGPDGLLAIYEGSVGSWPLYNAHGDMVATTDAAGALSVLPSTDEFGVSSAVGADPDGRLGWLGKHERFPTGGRLGLIRMGVRLYDPALGRFLSVDPVEGGCSNDYAYVFGDAVNDTDLSGTKKDCESIFGRIRRALFGDNYGDRGHGRKHGLIGVINRYNEQVRRRSKDKGHKIAYDNELRMLRNAVKDHDDNDCWNDQYMTANRMKYVGLARMVARRPYPYWRTQFQLGPLTFYPIIS